MNRNEKKFDTIKFEEFGIKFTDEDLKNADIKTLEICRDKLDELLIHLKDKL